MQAMTTLSFFHPVRSGVRAGMLSISLMEVAASFCVRSLRLGGPRAMTPRERTFWLQDAASTVLRRIGVEVVAEGHAPLEGLVVSNHLSYLDVLAYASIAPCVFVAKREVRGWPVFGAFATMAGTIYVDRERHAANGGAARLMEEALAAGLRVVLFPEGTSSDGRTALRFHSGFFEPAIRADAMVTAAAIGYGSSTAEEATIAYHGDDVFGPHLMRTVGLSHLKARVAFGTARRYADRKEAARTTQAEVERLRSVVARHSGTTAAMDLYQVTSAG
jgi:lyso-ornithine lipid O-acyltransferase